MYLYRKEDVWLLGNFSYTSIKQELYKPLLHVVMVMYVVTIVSSAVFEILESTRL